VSEEFASEEETLPFDVEVERLPAWVHVSSALVIVVGVLVAARLVPMLAFLPFLVASSVGRRFTSIATHIEVDEHGLDLGGREIPRSEIVDVWLDDDRSEARATVAFGDRVELAILHFENREQAKRFVDALQPKGGDERHSPVAGHVPRPIDWLSSLRFVAIAAAFFGTGSPLGAVVLAIFAFGAWRIVRARQLVVRADRLEIRSALGVSARPCSDIVRVDIEDGVLHLRGGGELHIPRSALRDTVLGSGPWLERARRRVLSHVAAARVATHRAEPQA